MNNDTQIFYALPLTGSTFFDTVIRLRAGEVVKKYPGLTLREEGIRLIFTGALSPEQAREFREEMD